MTHDRDNDPDLDPLAAGVGEMSDAELDLVLKASAAPTASEALQAAIMADFDAEARRPKATPLADLARALGAGRWRFGKYAPVGTLAGLSALGFAAGVASANDQQTVFDEEAVVYVSSAFDASLGGTDGAGLWADQ